MDTQQAANARTRAKVDHDVEAHLRTGLGVFLCSACLTIDLRADGRMTPCPKCRGLSGTWWPPRVRVVWGVA